jgi:hypothetical protein
MFEPGQIVQCKLADPIMKPAGHRLAMKVVSVAGDQVTVTWEDKDHGDRTETFDIGLLEPFSGVPDV